MFAVERTWDTESIANFHAKRDEQRLKKGLPAFHTLGPKEKADAKQEEKDTISSNGMKRMTLAACPLEKHPLQSCSATGDGYLICPKTLRGNAASSEKVRVRKGDNLFLLAYNHYAKGISGPPPGQNYISDDGISAKRHEFLGPAPCIAGFLETRSNIEILFWDSYISLAWIHENSWNVGVQFDDTVDSWVPFIQTASV